MVFAVTSSPTPQPKAADHQDFSTISAPRAVDSRETPSPKRESSGAPKLREPHLADLSIRLFTTQTLEDQLVWRHGKLEAVSPKTPPTSEPLMHSTLPIKSTAIGMLLGPGASVPFRDILLAATALLS